MSLPSSKMWWLPQQNPKLERAFATLKVEPGWDRPCAINEQKKSVDYPSPQECVGTHKDRTYAGSVPNVLVRMIQGKDTKTVSLGAAAGRDPGGRRAVYPSSPTLVRRSYASVLKG
jgi:hypothetical protein